tara:strand:+ start:897 stop:1184 length:288 start_codon:yes stop_codon:yes gene_type:complete
MLGHAAYYRPSVGRYHVTLLEQQGVHAASKFFNGLIGKQLPVPRQQMIIKHVNHDASVTTAFRRDSGLAQGYQRMGVGKAVYTSVQPDAFAYALR